MRKIKPEIEPGMASQLKLSLVGLVRQRTGQQIVLDRTNTRIKEIERAFDSNADDLLIGLQLTHSGRFCRPNAKSRLEPKIAYHHPLLDPKFGIDPRDISERRERVCLRVDHGSGDSGRRGFQHHVNRRAARLVDHHERVDK